jgi:peptidoglycan hydrolase CwlO-like protein
MKYIKNIILVILIVLVGYNLFTNNGIKTDVEAYNRKIDSLQHEIDSVETANKVIDGHIAKVDEEINVVETRITTINKNITEIKTHTNEKVNAVSDYTIHDLIKFFADRYENGLDSASKSTNGQVSH